MNWLDFVLLLIVAVSMATAFRKGLTREIVGLVAVILALLLGIWFYGTAGSLLAPYLSSHALANFVGFFLVFVGVMILGGVVNFIVGRFLKVTGLSILDHLLGAGFGALRGVLISVALIMGIMAFSPGPQAPKSVVRSKVAPYVVDAARGVASLAPRELRDGFRKTYAQVKQAWGSHRENGPGGLPNTKRENNETEL